MVAGIGFVFRCFIRLRSVPASFPPGKNEALELDVCNTHGQESIAFQSTATQSMRMPDYNPWSRWCSS